MEKWFLHSFVWVPLGFAVRKMVVTWLCVVFTWTDDVENGFCMALCGFHLVVCCGKMVFTWWGEISTLRCVVEKWFLHGFVWFSLGLVVWKNGFYMALCGLHLVL